MRNITHFLRPALLLPTLFFGLGHILFGQAALSLSSGGADGNGTVSLNLSLASPAGVGPSGLQWTFVYPTGALTNLSAAAGSALTQAGKNLTCAGGSGFYTCVAAGMNANIIPSGAVAVLTATMAPGSGTTAIAVSSPLGVSASGEATTVSAAGGNVTAGSTAAPVTTISALQCTPSSLPANSSGTCTLTVSQAAPASGVTVSLTASSGALTVPASVTVAGGSTAVTFGIQAGSVTSTQSVSIGAVLGASAQTVTVSVTGAAAGQVTLFSLKGVASEVSGTTNGSTVTPAAGPGGAVVVNGSGAVQFAAGGGVAFPKGGQQNQNAAFYSFAAGQQVPQIFNPAQGEIDFNLTSAYTFAQRSALPQYNYRTVFDVFDNANERFTFTVQAGNSLVFNYLTGGSGPMQYYYVPAGTEDSLFGKGTVLSVRLVWDGSTNSLYLNGNLAQTTPYTQAAANWTSQSSFAIGAQDAHLYGGGFFSCDDTIASFVVQGPSTSPAPPAPPAAVNLSSMQCNSSSLTSNGSINCLVNLSATAPSGGMAVAVSSTDARVTVPASVAVAAGLNTVSFAARAGAITTGGTATVTAKANGSAVSDAISLVALPSVSKLSCAVTTLLSGGSTSCTISLSSAAPVTTAVMLSSSNAAIAIPGSLSIAQGASSGAFTITGGNVTATTAVTLTATANGTLGAAAVTVNALPTLTSLTCAGSSLLSGGTITCTVSLTALASAVPLINLSASNTGIVVPASITIPAGMASATFIVTGGSILTKQAATVTASFGGKQLSASINLVPGTAPLFYLTGVASEVNGVSNGSIVTPTTGPKGSVVVQGTGAVKFSGGGVAFPKGGQQNQNTAFYTFDVGQQVGQIFNPAQGEIDFNLTSVYTFAQRSALPQYNYRIVFDVYDNSSERFTFNVQAGSALVFNYMVGGTPQTYIVPSGKEDAVFGKGTTLGVKLTWNGSTSNLSLNGQVVQTIAYTQAAANWTNLSTFSIGGSNDRVYGGGFFSCDDTIGDFTVARLP